MDVSILICPKQPRATHIADPIAMLQRSVSLCDILNLHNWKPVLAEFAVQRQFWRGGNRPSARPGLTPLGYYEPPLAGLRTGGGASLVVLA